MKGYNEKAKSLYTLKTKDRRSILIYFPKKDVPEEVRKKLSSKYYKDRIELAYTIWIIVSAIFVVLAVYAFYRHGFICMLIMIFPILLIGFICCKSIKSLKKYYEQAKLREIWQQKAKEQKEKEQREQKEKENEKQNEIDQNK